MTDEEYVEHIQSYAPNQLEEALRSLDKEKYPQRVGYIENQLVECKKAHIEEFTALHPEHAGQDRMMFEAWAIQKIAGLQLSVEHLAKMLNRHLNDNKGA